MATTHLAALNQFVKVHVRSTNPANSDLWVDSLDLGVMSGDKLLDHVKIGILKVFDGTGDSFLDLL